MRKHIIHLFKLSGNTNTACSRKSIKASKLMKYVNCKKCIGSVSASIKNRPKRHLSIPLMGNGHIYYDTACHTPRGKQTDFIEGVTCKKCLYLISKSLGSCQ